MVISGTTVGGEILVNTAIHMDQKDPLVVKLAGGGFVVVWDDWSQGVGGAAGDSRYSAVKAQVFDSAGGKVGGEILVNTAFEGQQWRATVAALSTGGFVVGWRDDSTPKEGSDIRAQVFSATGAKVGSESLVNTNVIGYKDYPVIAALANGAFVIAWEDVNGDSGGGSFTTAAAKARLYGADGLPTSGEFLLNTTLPGNQTRVQITTLADGGFAATWNDYQQGVLNMTTWQWTTPPSTSVGTQVFTANGAKVGGELRFGTFTGDQVAPVIAPLTNGNFVVTWSRYGEGTADANSRGVFAQVVNASGAAVGGVTLVNTAISNDQTEPRVARLSNGGFVITWTDQSGGTDDALGDDSYAAVKAQLFTAEGEKTGGEILVNTSTFWGQFAPQVASYQGGFIITWTDTSKAMQGDGGEVKAQAFQNSGVKIDGEVSVNTITHEKQEYSKIAILNDGRFVITWTDRSMTEPVNMADGQQSRDAVRAQLFETLAPPPPPTAEDDDAFTGESSAKTITVLGNDTHLGASVITHIAGEAAAIGVAVALASGATATLNSDGTITYNPNGKFNALVPTGSGAVNTSAEDSFVYTITGGDTAKVTVTVNGEAGAGDILGGSAGANEIAGTPFADQFDLSAGGNDEAHGLAGNDGFYFGGAFTASDTVDGGEGNDAVQLRGDYSVTLGEGTITSVERITALSGSTEGGNRLYDYNITSHDGNVAAGEFLTIHAAGLLAGEDLTFNGLAETNGMFRIYAGAGNDILVGGAQKDVIFGGSGDDALYGLDGDDQLTGGAGADTLRGGSGSDVYVYQAATDSTAASRDTIQDFQVGKDKIDLKQIDANGIVGDGNQQFSFIGTAAFGGVAGQLRVYKDGNAFFVEGDTDGNGAADFVLRVQSAGGLTVSDFFL